MLAGPRLDKSSFDEARYDEAEDRDPYPWVHILPSKGAGAKRVPLGVRERGRKRGDSGSAPDVPRESGPGDPECPGVGVKWGK